MLFALAFATREKRSKRFIERDVLEEDLEPEVVDIPNAVEIAFLWTKLDPVGENPLDASGSASTKS